MAIVEMKRMDPIALKRDRVRILSRLQKLGCVDVTENASEEAEKFRPSGAGRLEEAKRQIERLDWAIGKVRAFAPVKKGFLEPKPVRSDDDLLAARAAGVGHNTLMLKNLGYDYNLTIYPTTMFLAPRRTSAGFRLMPIRGF